MDLLKYLPKYALAPILALGLVLVTTSGAHAQSDPTTITIHLSECPTGYSGNDPFADCHSNGIAGVTFEWTNSEAGPPQLFTTDNEGVAQYRDLLAGDVLYITERPPFDLASYSVYCSANDGATAVPFAYQAAETGILFASDTFSGGEEVICDWYNIRVGTPSGGDTGNNGGGQETVSQLPSTGSGVSNDSELPTIPIALAVAALSGVFTLGLRRRALV